MADPIPGQAPVAAPAPATTQPIMQTESVSAIDAALEAAFNSGSGASDTPPATTAAAPSGTRVPGATAISSAATSAQATAPATAPTPVADPAPVAANPDDATPTDGRILPNRIATSQFATVDQRAIALSHTLNEGKKPSDAGFVPLKRCIEQIEAADASGQSQVTQPTQETHSRLEVTAQAAEQARVKVTELETKIAEFKENPTLYSDELAEATAELADAKMDVKLADRDAKAAEQESATRQEAALNAEMQASKATAKAKYPSLDDKSSPLRSVANDIANAMKDPAHPEHFLLNSGKAPEIIADRAANLLAQRIAQQKNIPVARALAELLGAAAEPAAATVTQVTEEPRRVFPSPGSEGTPVVVPKTAAQIVQEVGENWKDADALLAGGRADPYLIR